ncbi:MAG: tRNA glutamyl-Q(34) synthetase GluQRS [Pseudomonadales bacterium]
MMAQSGAGRFAPSPTGSLHLGSLLTAVASWLDAKARACSWTLRFDDLDTPRTVPGAEDAIRRTLEAHGLLWDGPVIRQSARLERYAASLERLQALDLTYYCTCSRLTLAGHPIYPGTCRTRSLHDERSSVRFRSGGGTLSFFDLFQGLQLANLATETGDFVIRRRDGVFAYALATAVDDGSTDITRVVRGRDLLAQTASQIALIDALGLTRPDYAHLPLVINGRGQKLSKQTHARALNNVEAVSNLRWVLAALNQPAAETPAGTAEELLSIATLSWDPGLIPRADVHAAPL